MKSKKKPVPDAEPLITASNGKDTQGVALDAIQTELQIIICDAEEVVSVDLTRETVIEMKHLAAKFSRAIMQAELKLNQT